MTTKENLIAAAVQTVRELGYAGTTSRAIAGRGNFNPALIYYHYGSVDALLLAALDKLGAERLARYESLVDAADSLEELVDAAARMYRSDRRSGHVAFVSQMVAASFAKPELASEVLARMEPWIDFTERALRKAAEHAPIVEAPVEDLAYAVVTYYLGLNLLTELDPRRARPDALFARLRELARVFAT